MDTKHPFCFHCGKKLMYANGQPLYETRDHHGNKVKMHKGCAKEFDNERPVTAAPRQEK